MSVNIHQEIKLTVRQQMVMTIQQQQSLKMLQYSTQEFEAELYKILQENPFLEVDPSSLEIYPENSLSQNNHEEVMGELQEIVPSYEANSEDYYSPEIKEIKTLQDYLLEQLGTSQATPQQKSIISYFIGDIDDNGYLTSDLTELSSLLSHALGVSITIAMCEEALGILHSFDPAGIGARDLSECLLLQLRAENLSVNTSPEVIDAAKRICTQGLEALARADIEQLKTIVHADKSLIQKAHHLIQQLNPKPGRLFSAVEADMVVPDVLCRFVNGQWSIFLNPHIMPRIRVHPEYERVMRLLDKKSSSDEMREQLHQARTFIQQMQHRLTTILAVAQTIMQEQYAFFENGLSAIKPLVLKDIAQGLSLHESTISRAINQKYIATPHGIFELKRFFSSGIISSDGQQTSAVAIQQRIKILIEGESMHKPLSDNRLSELLAQEGIDVARRTITKYRELLNIPTASVRKAQAVFK